MHDRYGRTTADTTRSRGLRTTLTRVGAGAARLASRATLASPAGLLVVFAITLACASRAANAPLTYVEHPAGAPVVGSPSAPAPTPAVARQASTPASPSPSAPAPASDTLVIMLPGFGDTGAEFVRHGFVQRLQAARPGVDVITVDATFAYYARRTLLTRLDEDVLAPARRRGYQKIWLVGISMGGIGALLAAKKFEADIDGIVLIAPYLGRRGTLKDVARSGGVRAWDPPKGEVAWDVEVWRWIHGYVEGAARPKLYLAYGTDDAGARAHALLAEVVPTGQLVRAPGGHRFDVWSRLWTQLLAGGLLAEGAAKP